LSHIKNVKTIINLKEDNNDMTRAQIREKHGISMLESPSVANKELSEKEATEYENFVPDVNTTEPQSLINAIP